MLSSRETKCIPQCNSFVLLGVSLQSDGKFNEHVRTKFVKARPTNIKKGTLLSGGDRSPFYIYCFT